MLSLLPSDNTMKRSLLLLIFVTVIACSCTTYQIGTLESLDADPNFEYKTDDLTVTYDFWAQGGQLRFTITNNTESPIYIDWTHSNFIINGYAFDYFADSETIRSAEVYGSSSVSGLINLNPSSLTLVPGTKKTTEGTAAGYSVVQRDARSKQVPPRSFVLAKVINLAFPFRRLKGDSIKFTAENSPMTVRSYIGYAIDKEMQDLTFLDAEFYVAQLEQTSSITKVQEAEAFDRFYIRD